jgi:peptidoglycan/LPS O-acetylase OafA/YrhL
MPYGTWTETGAATAVFLFSALSNWNLPAWTLSVEFLFYLVFPVLSCFADRLGRGMTLALLALCALVVVGTASSNVSSNVGAPQLWMRYVPLPLLRLPEFLIGILLGQLATRREGEKRPSLMPWLLTIAIVAALAASQDPHVASAVTLLSAALVYNLATSAPGRIYALLSWRPLVLLGVSSYSLYLLHGPVHDVLKLLGGNSKVVLALQYPLSISVALLVFRFYEEPAREALRAYWRMRRSAIARI